MADSYKEFFDLASELFAVIDSQLTIRQANQAWVDLLGLAESALVNKMILNFVHSADRLRVEKLLAQAQSQFSNACTSARLQKADGGFLWTELKVRFDKTLNHYILVATNINATKEIEAELIEKSLRLESFDSVLQKYAIVSKTDPKGKITFANHHFEDISGYKKEEIIGQDHRILNSKTHSKEFFANMWASLLKGVPWQGQICNRAKNGNLYWVDTSITPVLDAFGKIKEFISIRYDITHEILEAHKLKESEQRLDEAQKVAKIGSWSYNFSSKKIDWTPQMYEIFPEDPQKGEPTFERHYSTIHQEERGMWLKTIKQCEQDGQEYVMRFRVVHPEKTVWVEARGRGMLDHNNKIIGLFGTCQDISDFMRREEEHNYLLQAARIGIWKWDVKKDQLAWDKSMFELFEIKPENFSGAYDAWEKSLQPIDRARAVEELQNALKGQAEFDTSFLINSADGKEKKIGARGKVIFNDKKEPTQMWGVNWDLTREYNLYKKLELEKAKTMQTSKLATLGEMASGVAHEINNPLAIIGGNVELLVASANDPEKLQKKADTIQKAVERIAKIITGLRKFSRSTAKKEYKDHFVANLLAEVAVLVDPKAVQCDVKITYEVSTQSSIACDEVEVQQVLINVINNAIDAVKSLNTRWVLVKAFDHQDQVVFQVVDAGKGIEESIRNKIFEPFFTTKPVGQGTGLGMSISKGIVEDHAGTIEILPEASNTTFEIRFNKTKTQGKQNAA